MNTTIFSYPNIPVRISEGTNETYSITYPGAATYALFSIPEWTLCFHYTSHYAFPLIIYHLTTVSPANNRALAGWQSNLVKAKQSKAKQSKATQRDSPRKNPQSKKAPTRITLYKNPIANYATLKILSTSNLPAKPMDMPSTTQNRALKAYHAAMTEQHAERGCVRLCPYEREMVLL
jgi:hypothetical protein